MKKKRLSSGTRAALACLFSLFLLCCSCTQEEGLPAVAGEPPLTGEDEDPQAGSELVVGGINIALGEMDAGAQTRATTTLKLTSGSIGVGIRAENGYTAQTAKYTYNSSTNRWETDTPIQLKSKPAGLYAWYPYEAVPAPPIVQLKVQAYSDDKSLCYTTSGGGNVCATHPNATFELRPAYSRLTITISWGAEFPALKDIRLNAADGMITSGCDLDLATGTYTVKSQELSTAIGSYSQRSGNTITSDVLMIGAGTDHITTILITTNNDTWKVTISSITPQTGKIHSFKLNINNEYLNPGLSPTIDEYGTGGSVNFSYN